MLQLIQISKEELMQDFEKIMYKVLQQMQLDKASKDEKPAYTRKETAEILNVSFGTLYNWKKSGTLIPTTKIGERVYYSKKEVLARLNP
ncbi:helix-turn-helix domain-containing protein [Chryseobacterium rhizosphaerae]|uniref:helix-turn-helix domain-containing protein n=1 Tax=Chryseobacterium rhizosphaerae TaxID=395937 RepID=UPI002359A870|nr:helix-turn-helix domain-containing protein [Chryseobacterium rhizosphaerae]MDC8098602.1 helix-turn-helix domain-containing protein [Chryseobacterium rhizosphaerae]